MIAGGGNNCSPKARITHMGGATKSKAPPSSPSELVKLPLAHTSDGGEKGGDLRYIYEIRAENTMLGGVGDVAVTTPRHSAALLRGSLLFVVLTVTFSRVIKTQRLQSQMIRPPLIKSRHFPPAKNARRGYSHICFF